MKKLFFLLGLNFIIAFVNAQGIGVGTSSPAASAMLDITSTSKGLLIPRMTSVQRSAITTPAVGLLVFDADTKTVWAYDGAAWKNLYTSGGLVLPFSQTVNTGISAFQVTNQGIGAALEGSSSAEFGTGLTAKTTGPGGWGLYALSTGAGAKSINAFADNGTAIHGENNNPANTNTLLSLINKGIGKTSTFQLVSPASTAYNVQIAGNNLGEQLKIFQTNVANAAPAISVVNSGTGDAMNATSTTGPAVVGTSTSNYGIKGFTNTATGAAGVYGQNTGTAGSGVIGTSNAANTQGIYGLSNNGIGVRAVTDNHRAVQAVAASGTALYGISTSGYALESNGFIKISGGNTNPTTGAVLTSDASGNATWQQSAPAIGFKASGLMNGFAEIGNNVDVKVQFASQEYDLGMNFIALNENANLNETNSFYPPVNGLYHFDLSIAFFLKSAGLTHYDYDFAIASIKIVRNGNTIEVSRFSDSDPGISAEVRGSTDVVLNAGDKVYITARQSNFTGVSMPLDSQALYTVFSGHLVKKL